MTVLISQYTVYLFGVVIVALSVWGFVVPNRLIALVTGSMNRGAGLYVGIGSRVVLGVALIVAAPPARFPILFAVLGWISIAGGHRATVVRPGEASRASWLVRTHAHYTRSSVVGVRRGSWRLPPVRRLVSRTSA